MEQETPAAIAIIPARGGSKRVPGKNTRMLSGRPAIAYTIDAAVMSGVFERVIVSTDSSDIADIAVACGAEVPFTRSASISDDYTPVSVVTIDAIQRADPASHFGIVAQLMANCPLRTAEDVADGFAHFTSGKSESQLSVSRYGWLNPWWAMTLDEDRRLELVHGDRVIQRSQDLPEVFCPTGAVWFGKTEAVVRSGTFHLDGRTGCEIPWDHAVDIDTEDDWRMAELLLDARARNQQS
jgi:CMP-N-acetylneuraminic acid synthetase